MLSRGDDDDRGDGGGFYGLYGTAEGWCGEIVNARGAFVVGFERGCDRLEGVHSVAEVQAEIRSQNETQLLSSSASPSPVLPPQHAHGVFPTLDLPDQYSDVEDHRSGPNMLAFHEMNHSANSSHPAQLA